ECRLGAEAGSVVCKRADIRSRRCRALGRSRQCRGTFTEEGVHGRKTLGAWKNRRQFAIIPYMIKIPRNLRAYQVARIRDILAYVQERVPHYLDQLQKAGLSPRGFSDLSDLCHVPFTTKGDLQSGYPLGFLAI